MKNKKVVIAIILCIGAVISLIYGLTAGSKTRRKPSSEAVSVHEAALPARPITSTKRRAAKTDFDSWSRNPFAPKKTSDKVVVKLTLSGIIWDDKEPKALINDVVVGIGDKIDENTVVEIEQNRVILNDGTEDIVLTLD